MSGIVGILFILLLLLPPVSPAASPEILHSLRSQLEKWEVEEAWTEIHGVLGPQTQDPSILELASQVAFYRGDYAESLKWIKAAIERGGGSVERQGFALLVEQTLAVTRSFRRYETPHFVISLEEKQDGILVDYLTEALEKTHRVMAERYGFEPREKIRIEVFPDTRAFYFASTLSARDIEVAGAVGLANFNKLMILSPRALVHGYRFLDALSHEYLHYLIVKRTANKAPIWFHEGLAKYEETRWRDGPSYLSPVHQTLLARALAQGKLISFKRMEPSLVKLETPEEIQLAYTQAASAVEFIVEKSGTEGLRLIMDRMARSSKRGMEEAIQEVFGWRFPEFERSWKEALAARQLKEIEAVNLRRYKIKEGKGDEERMDMAEIKSMVARNRAHLGDLLRERGRPEAAVLEYRRALAEDQGSIPITHRLSGLLIKMNRDPEALEILREAQKMAPDHPTVFSQLGRIYLKRKDWKEAKEALWESIQINPFNPEVHRDLAEAYEGLGDRPKALREREIFKKLIQ